MVRQRARLFRYKDGIHISYYGAMAMTPGLIVRLQKHLRFDRKFKAPATKKRRKNAVKRRKKGRTAQQRPDV